MLNLAEKACQGQTVLCYLSGVSVMKEKKFNRTATCWIGLSVGGKSVEKVRVS